MRIPTKQAIEKFVEIDYGDDEMARNKRKPTDVTSLFAKRLDEATKEEMKRTGKNQKTIAGEIGITESSLSDYRVDGKTPNIDSLYKICKHFNLSADYMLGLSSTKSPSPNIKSTIETTGLSEHSVKVLSNCKMIANDVKGKYSFSKNSDESDRAIMLPKFIDLFIDDNSLINVIIECFYQINRYALVEKTTETICSHEDEIDEFLTITEKDAKGLSYGFIHIMTTGISNKLSQYISNGQTLFEGYSERVKEKYYGGGNNGNQ